MRAAGIDVLKKALRFCREEGIDFFILGAGSNLFVPDAGFRGMAIKIEMRDIRFDDCLTVAGAGAKLARLVRESAAANLSGLEFATGIPGTVGGAAIMNAGAFGGQIGESIRRVTAVDPKGREHKILQEDIEFGYRRSSLRDSGLIITEVELELSRGEPEKIQERLREVQQLRGARQPTGFSAGCVFKNPPGHSSGRLIDGCGLKGLRKGGAEISTGHANYIINRGNARYQDVKKLMNTIVKKVREKYDVELTPEIVDLGVSSNIMGI